MDDVNVTKFMKGCSLPMVKDVKIKFEDCTFDGFDPFKETFIIEDGMLVGLCFKDLYIRKRTEDDMKRVKEIQSEPQS